METSGLTPRPAGRPPDRPATKPPRRITAAGNSREGPTGDIRGHGEGSTRRVGSRSDRGTNRRLFAKPILRLARLAPSLKQQSSATVKKRYANGSTPPETRRERARGTAIRGRQGVPRDQSAAMSQSEGLHQKRAAAASRVEELTRQTERETLEADAYDRLYRSSKNAARSSSVLSWDQSTTAYCGGCNCFALAIIIRSTSTTNSCPTNSFGRRRHRGHA